VGRSAGVSDEGTGDVRGYQLSVVSYQLISRNYSLIAED
jgi:hypothetical protein